MSSAMGRTAVTGISFPTQPRWLFGRSVRRARLHRLRRSAINSWHQCETLNGTARNWSLVSPPSLLTQLIISLGEIDSVLGRCPASFQCLSSSIEFEYHASFVEESTRQPNEWRRCGKAAGKAESLCSSRRLSAHRLAVHAAQHCLCCAARSARVPLHVPSTRLEY